MQWQNSEMSLFLKEDKFIVLRVNEGVKKLSVSAAEECVDKIQEAMKINEHPKVIFFYIAEIYVPKNVIRCYANTVFEEVGVAVFCASFASWLIGNIAVTIRKRFMASNPAAGAPIKAFKIEEEAIEWSLDLINKAS